MGELTATGLLGTASLMAHPEKPMTAPLVVWQPGLDRPDLASTAHRARSRWTAPGVATQFVFATREAAHLIGGEPGRAPRPSEATHDLHLAAVYLLMWHELPTRTRSWRSEVLALADRSLRQPTPGDKMPDALVRDGRCRTVIEFVGEYSVEKLISFHDYCVRAHLGYELW